MAFWDEFEEWFGRRPFARFFREMDRAFGEMFEDFSKRMPKELYRERKLPDGTTVRTLGPLVYGYSMTVGPDGKPKIRTFGNLEPGVPLPRPTERREPIIEVVPTPYIIRVIAEIPGVNKEDIDLRVREDKLTISVDTKERKYFKEVELLARVDPKSVDASYQNGVLEVTLRRLKEEKPGEKVNIK